MPFTLFFVFQLGMQPKFNLKYTLQIHADWRSPQDWSSSHSYVPYRIGGQMSALCTLSWWSITYSTMHAVCVSQTSHMFPYFSVTINSSKVLSAVNILIPVVLLSDVRKEYPSTWWNHWCCAHPVWILLPPWRVWTSNSVTDSYWQWPPNTHAVSRSLSLWFSLRACTSISGIWISTWTVLTSSCGYLCRTGHLQTVGCNVLLCGLFGIVCE